MVITEHNGMDRIKKKINNIGLHCAPSGDFNQFMKTSDSTMKYLYNSKSEFIICGDMNTDYFNVNYQKKTTTKTTV
jgi:hypothetical protein